MSTMLTQWQKLWISKGQTFWIHWRNKKMASRKTSEHQQLSCHLNFKLQSLQRWYNHILMWKSPTYSVHLHSAKVCTLCWTQMTFIQEGAAGGCKTLMCVWAGELDTNRGQRTSGSLLYWRKIKKRVSPRCPNKSRISFYWFRVTPSPTYRKSASNTATLISDLSQCPNTLEKWPATSKTQHSM